MDINNDRVSPNDSIWFCMFDWLNMDTAAHRIGVDICWTEAKGNTLSYLDARLENELYVTIGLRQEQSGAQKAHMSVLHDPKNAKAREAFLQLLKHEPLPCKGFSARRGRENDLYYIGDFSFEFGEYYRLIILAHEKQIEGYVLRLSTQDVGKIGTFPTGEGSRIRARRGREHTNGVTLEHFGMVNACEYKSSILIRNPLRVDINGVRATASRGRVDYQKCSNSNVDRDEIGNIILSHGGDIVREGASHLEFLLWSEVPIEIDIDLSNYVNK